MTETHRKGWNPYWFWAGVAVVTIGLVHLFQPVLLPFVAGILLAYLLDPPVNRLTRLGLGRGWATLVVLLVFAVLLVGVLLLVVPMLQQQLSDMITKLPDLIASLQDKVMKLIATLRTRVSAQDMQRLQDAVGGHAGDILGVLPDVLLGLLTKGLALFNVLSLVFITPVVAFYMMRDWPLIVATVDGWLPKRQAPTIRRLFVEMDQKLSGYIRGVSMICIILAVFYGTALSAVGLDFGLVVGLLAGFLAFIPFVGSIFGFVVGVGLAFAQFSDLTSVALVAAVFLIGQAVEGNVLQPMLVGRQVNLHAVWIIFALLAGGAVFGFLGVLLAVPFAVVIAVLVRYGIEQYRESQLYLGDGGPPPGR
ncbi:MAG TPA: AI-2E family transporter [Alphaproteobacteria bacterium]|jgi:predicted PurR-regulated permease PerM